MARTAATTTPAPSCCAAPPPKPAAACRRSSRGCPSPPAPASRGADSSPAAPAWRSPSTAPRRSRSPPSRRGSPRRRRPTRSSSRSSSTAASTRSACSPRSATRATRSCARTWRWPPTRGPNSPRTRRLRWHPSAAGLATLHEEGKVSAFPAIGYEHPDQSHFTSRHYYEIGELDVGFHTGWLGRYIDQVGEEDNPLQGLSMDGSLSPMIATAEPPVAAIDSVDGYDLWSPVSDPVDERDVQELRPLRLAALRLPGAGAGAPRDRPDRQAAHRPGRDRRLHQPGLLSRNGLRPQARRPRRLHRRRPADAGGDDPRLGRLRHPRRRGRRPLARA